MLAPERATFAIAASWRLVFGTADRCRGAPTCDQSMTSSCVHAMPQASGVGGDYSGACTSAALLPVRARPERHYRHRLYWLTSPGSHPGDLRGGLPRQHWTQDPLYQPIGVTWLVGTTDNRCGSVVDAKCDEHRGAGNGSNEDLVRQSSHVRSPLMWCPLRTLISISGGPRQLRDYHDASVSRESSANLPWLGPPMIAPFRPGWIRMQRVSSAHRGHDSN